MKAKLVEFFVTIGSGEVCVRGIWLPESEEGFCLFMDPAAWGIIIQCRFDIAKGVKRYGDRRQVLGDADVPEELVAALQKVMVARRGLNAFNDTIARLTGAPPPIDLMLVPPWRPAKKKKGG